jgi:hypothetical protein
MPALQALHSACTISYRLCSSDEIPCLTTGACPGCQAAEGGAANSHLAGIFNRAAKECEKEIATFVREDLGESVSQKATLGQLGDRIAAKSGPSPQLSDLAEEVKRANRVWIEIKHLSDPPVNNLRKGLEAIRDVFGLLETTIHHE